MPAKAKAAAAPAPVSSDDDSDFKAPAAATAAAADDGGWETVTDERRERYQKSKVRKAAEAQAALLARQDLSSEEAKLRALAQVDITAAKLAGEQPFRIDAKALKGKNGEKKKKKSSGPKWLVISSEQQLVDAVVGIVSNVPNSQRLPLSAVGDKLQELTNKSWKKAYAPAYGSLPDFFKAHAATFHVSPDQRVSLRSEHTPKPAAAADPLATGAPKKKKAKGSAAGAGAGAGNGNAVVKAKAAAVEVADDNLAMRVLLVVVLIIGVGIGVFCALEGITFGQFVARLRAALF